MVEFLDALSAIQAPTLNVYSFLFSLFSSALLAYLLGFFYVRYGSSISNRKRFAKNFVLLAVTTTLIITVVKSSLALSLGLVGALSIVRFRSAIKEPEELAFLFLTIAIGLGFGADQWKITYLAFIVILAILYFRYSRQVSDEGHGVFLSLQGKKSHTVTLSSISKILNKHCKDVYLKRMDDESHMLELTFLVDMPSFSHLESLTHDLHSLDSSLKVTYFGSQV